MKAYLLPLNMSEGGLCNPNSLKFEEARFIHFAETDGYVMSLQELERRINEYTIDLSRFYIIFR